MTRRRIPAKVRARIFLAANGECHICGLRIDAGREPWEVEHVIALALGGEDDESNMRPAHVGCHRRKSAADVAANAKGARMEQRALGIRKQAKHPLPGSRASGWKKPINGPAVRRD